MKPRRLKELLTFAIVHKAPELSASKKEQLEVGLMKLNTDELEILDDVISSLNEQNKPSTKRKAVEENDKVEETA